MIYPDEHERKLHFAYDFITNETYYTYDSSTGITREYTMVGGDEATTVSTKSFIDNEQAQAGRTKLVLSLLTKSRKKTGKISSGVMVRYTYECKMRSFEEFAAQPNVDKLADQIVVYEWDNAGCSAEKLAASKGMSDLSDAIRSAPHTREIQVRSIMHGLC